MTVVLPGDVFVDETGEIPARGGHQFLVNKPPVRFIASQSFHCISLGKMHVDQRTVCTLPQGLDSDGAHGGLDGFGKLPQ